MDCARPWRVFWALTLSWGAACGFDTTPLGGGSAGTGSLTGAAAAGSTSSAGLAPRPEAGAAAPPSNSAVSVPVAGVPGSVVAVGSAGSGVTTPSAAAGSPATVPPPVATAGKPAPPAVPPVAGASAGGPAMPPARCDAVGSYGLRLRADVSWDVINGLTGPGRGPVEIYMLLEVNDVDAQTGAVDATGRVCGLALPAMASPLNCNGYEFRFADKLWEQRDLPQLAWRGTQTCAAASCKLQLAPPLDYLLGIHLDPADSPWPGAGTTPLSQFRDDDGDSLPGVTADIISLATTPTNANPSCYPSSGSSTGMSGSGAGGEAGRVMLGLRTKLEAALDLSAECRVTEATGALHSLELRAGGCMLETAWNPAQPAMGPMGHADNASLCTDDVRAAMDYSLPSYRVLAAGEAPATGSTIRDVSPSRGSVLQAVRLGPGHKPSCDQVRKAVF